MSESKRCSRCKQVLPHEAFHKKASTPTGLNSSCRNCANEMKRAMSPEQRAIKNAKNRSYRLSNPEFVKVTNRNQYLAKRKERIAYANQWQKDNPELHKIYARNSKQRNHLKVAADTRRRNARRKANGVFSISKKELERLNRGRCFYCGTTERITIDHVVAIARGGTDSIGNLVPACKSCNSRKRELTIMEWRLKRKPPRAYAL